MHTTTLAAISFASFAYALPLLESRQEVPTVPDRFYSFAISDSTEINGAGLEARSYAVWVGGPTEAKTCGFQDGSCLLIPQLGFRVQDGAAGSISLNTLVPDSQLLYHTGESGAVVYTAPGAERPSTEDVSDNSFSISNEGGNVQPDAAVPQWHACLEDGGRRVYASPVEGQDCLPFTWGTTAVPETTGPSAREYV